MTYAVEQLALPADRWVWIIPIIQKMLGYINIFCRVSPTSWVHVLLGTKTMLVLRLGPINDKEEKTRQANDRACFIWIIDNNVVMTVRVLK